MSALAGLTTYGISCAVIAAGIASGVIPDELHFVVTIVWAAAGLALAWRGQAKAKEKDG